MGWQTGVLNLEVFPKETYNSLFDVDEDIKIKDKVIQSITNKLCAYCLSRPSDILINRPEDTIENLKIEVENDVLNLIDFAISRYRLQILKDNFLCRSGDFVQNEDYKENIKKWLIENEVLTETDFADNIK